MRFMSFGKNPPPSGTGPPAAHFFARLSRTFFSPCKKRQAIMGVGVGVETPQCQKESGKVVLISFMPKCLLNSRLEIGTASEIRRVERLSLLDLNDARGIGGGGVKLADGFSRRYYDGPAPRPGRIPGQSESVPPLGCAGDRGHEEDRLPCLRLHDLGLVAPVLSHRVGEDGRRPRLHRLGRRSGSEWGVMAGRGQRAAPGVQRPRPVEEGELPEAGEQAAGRDREGRRWPGGRDRRRL